MGYVIEVDFATGQFFSTRGYKRVDSKETAFWSEYKALSEVLTINQFLKINYPNSTQGKKDNKPIRFNPDF